MNDAIHIVGRDRKKAPATMPLEVRMMAQQMGIPLEDMEMAGGMWTKLNELESSDPEGYKELVSESARRVTGGDVEEKIGEAASAAMKKVLPRQTLTPTRGFVLKCRTRKRNRKVMVNCCSHKAVQPPVDSSGRELVVDMPADGLQVPMFVGDARTCRVSGGDEGVALDVVFNPSVLERAATDQDFKLEVSNLALRWASEEKKIDVDLNNWKYIKSQYKGGSGPDEDEPVPFSVSPTDVKPSKNHVSSSSQSGGPTGIIATPESLLRRLRRDDQDAAAVVEDIKIPSASTNTKPKEKPLIQEIENDDVIELEADGFDMSTAAPKKKPAVLEKGFLKKSKKSLYPPEGSDQGQKEGVYSRFLGKCKVVDASTLPKKKDALQTDAGAAAVDTPSVAAGSDKKEESGGFKKGFLTRDPEFDALASEADPELGAAMGEQRAHETAEVEETLEQLRELTNRMNLERGEVDFTARPPGKDTTCSSQQSDSSASPRECCDEQKTVVQKADDAFRFKSGFLEEKKKTARQERCELIDLSRTQDGRRRVKMTVTLEDKSIESMDEVELRVADHLVELRHAKMKMEIPLPSDFVADTDRTKARFSKHNGRLAITLTSATEKPTAAE